MMTLLQSCVALIVILHVSKSQETVTSVVKYQSSGSINICRNSEGMCTTEESDSVSETLSGTYSSLNLSSTQNDDSDQNTTVESSAPEENNTALSDSVGTLSPSDLPDSKVADSQSPRGVTGTPPRNFKPKLIYEDNCACDLEQNSCDINCCCDDDCSEEDRGVFLKCEDEFFLSPDPQYCYNTHFLYKNNTEYKSITTNNGLFCILKENLPVHLKYSEGKIMTSISDIKNSLAMEYMHPWQDDDVKLTTFNSTLRYKAHSIVWSVYNSTVLPLSFPTKITNEFCHASQNLRYLNNWSGHCSHIIKSCSIDDDDLSASQYYKTLTIVADPQLINETQIDISPESCPNTTCLPVTPFLCDGSFEINLDECVEVENIEGTWLDRETYECVNIVQSVKYLVYHNGSQGISKIEAYIWLINITLEDPIFRQNFEIMFTWVGKQRRPFQRSGRPGYILGKPIMAGKKVFQPSNREEEPDREAIMLSYDPLYWLTIPKPLSDGSCTLRHEHDTRSVVRFGENQRTSCAIYLKASDFSNISTCLSVQKKIIQIMVGNIIENITDSKLLNLYVATFGDSSVEDTGDWVQVLLENPLQYENSLHSSTLRLMCKNIIKTFHISVLYVYSGNVRNPQAKVVGTSFKFGNPDDLIFKCLPLGCEQTSERSRKQFQISSSVSFFDVSPPAKLFFAKPPVYEIKLPYDFFYPFLPSTQPRNINFQHVLLTLILCSLLHIFFISCNMS